MKFYLLLLCFLCVHGTSSTPILNTLGNIGTAVKNAGTSLLGKLAGVTAQNLPSMPSMPSMPSLNPLRTGNILTQLEYVNGILVQLKNLLAYQPPGSRAQMKDYTDKLVNTIIPQFNSMAITKEQLMITHKLTEEEVKRFKVVIKEFRINLNAVKEILEKN